MKEKKTMEATAVERKNVRTYQNVTIYVEGMFGFLRIDAKSVEVWTDKWTDKYAQYAEAEFVRFVEKGKRKPRGFIKAGSGSSFVIVEGLGQPELGAPQFTDNGNGSRITTYSSYDARWALEFARALEASGLNVLERKGV
jgi:hypothetical protein